LFELDFFSLFSGLVHPQNSSNCILD